MIDVVQIQETFSSIGTVKGTARALGLDRRTVRRYLSNAKAELPKKKPRQSCGMTRSELLAKYDDVTKAREAIRKGVERITNGITEQESDDEVLDEAQFKAEMCDNVVSPQFKRVALEQEFKKYRFAIGEKVFWTTPRTKAWSLKNISKAREVES